MIYLLFNGDDAFRVSNDVDKLIAITRELAREDGVEYDAVYRRTVHENGSETVHINFPKSENYMIYSVSDTAESFKIYAVTNKTEEIKKAFDLAMHESPDEVHVIWLDR